MAAKRQRPGILQGLVAAALRERRIELSHSLAAYALNPTGDAVHDLRVALRRAEAAARLFKGFPAHGHGREARRLARDLRKSLSTHRQREVSLALVQTLRGADPTAVEALARLPHWASPDPKSVVASGRQLGSLLRRWALASKDAPPGDDDLEALSRTLRRRLRKVRRKVLRYGIPTDRTLHRQRIAGKALRYELELVMELEPAADAIVKASRGFQEALGQAHDWDEARNDLALWRDELPFERRLAARPFLARLALERRRAFRKARKEAALFVKLLARTKLGKGWPGTS